MLNRYGIFKKLFLGGIAAKTYQNVYIRPIVIPPPGYVIRGLQQKGIGSKWIIKYSKEKSMNVTSTFSVTGSTRSVSVGADKFSIDWP